jgi:hypothetical protein
VSVDNGTPQIIINGTAYKLSQLLSLMPTSTVQPPVTPPISEPITPSPRPTPAP